MKTETLLEKAKKAGKRGLSKEITDEEIDLYLALIKKEIGAGQASEVLFPDKMSNLYSRGFTVIKEAYKRGRIKII